MRFFGYGSLVPYYQRLESLYKRLTNHETPAVRKWATKHAEWMGTEAERERKSDEEDQLLHYS